MKSRSLLPPDSRRKNGPEVQCGTNRGDFQGQTVFLSSNSAPAQKLPATRVAVGKKLLGSPCGAHVFEGFFGLEDEPIKSVKMKVETRSGILWRLPHEFALCNLQFRFALRVSVTFHCVEPHPPKKR